VTISERIAAARRQRRVLARVCRAGALRGRAVMTARSARILAAAAGLTAAAPAGFAAALINAAIVRKPPVSDETAEDGDLVAATTAAAQREGRAWMAATPHQRWTVTAHDGTRLAGYYFPAPRPAQCTVILIHGHRADASLMGNFARDYRARGFNVFMADNRAHGDSGGRYVGMGWLDHLDYLRWISRLAGHTSGSRTGWRVARAGCQVGLPVSSTGGKPTSDGHPMPHGRAGEHPDAVDPVEGVRSGRTRGPAWATSPPAMPVS
jgi:hypothetical protein